MRAALTVVAVFAMAGSAGAACFEDIGCTDSDAYARSALRQLSCENLWFTRNTIYNEHGLCFKTAAGRAQFDNSDCSVNNPAKVKLNRTERANVAKIRQVEQEMGCTD